MTKLNQQFEEFLQNIEPNRKAVKYAQSAHEPVREYLEQDKAFGEFFEDSFLYGSYKRHTTVGDIKDVDIVVLTNFDYTSADCTPSKVLRKLKNALARYYKDPENPEYQRRSIRINEPLPDEQNVEMTLDIIPAVAPDGQDQPLLVPDREVAKWIPSHPKGHLRHTTELNRPEYSGERFVPLVKIMKWWWKYQCQENQPDVERPKPKGFWIEVLVGENFDPKQHDWVDHFIFTLENVALKYSLATQVPELPDPGIPGQTIKTSMTLDEFQIFMSAVNHSLEQAKAARANADNLASSEIYREIFGDKFPLFDSAESQASKLAAKSVALASTSHAQSPTWPVNLQSRYDVRIDAYVYNGQVKTGGINSDGRILPSGLAIKYVARVRARDEFQVFWQVVNTGPHAASENGLRGDFFFAKLDTGGPSTNSLINWEHTKYTGKHWIQCFIVKDGRLVGRSERFYINIKNPNY